MSITSHASFRRHAGRVITFAALVTTACGESSRRQPAADGSAVALPRDSSTISHVTYDDQRRTWFLVHPMPHGADVTSEPTLVCRWSGRELACGAIPAPDNRRGEPDRRVELIAPANGAVPHLLVQDERGAQIWEPFSWRVVRRFDGIALDLEELLVWADGSVLATSFHGPQLARPDDHFRTLTGFPRVEYPQIHVSRWGLVWLEHGATRDDSTLKAAPFDGFALGPTRSYGHHGSWFRACRDGDTFGLMWSDEQRSVTMVDLASGVAASAPVGVSHQIQCRPGEVAGIAIDLRNEPSARCDHRGCRMYFTPPSREGLNYHQLALVDGALLLVSGGLGPGQFVSQRTDAAPRLQRVTGCDYFQNAQLVMTHEGALGIYLGGAVIAFDHHGTPMPIDLRWVDSSR